MKIAIAGSGALGCRFGSMLHEAGNEVLLIDNWKEHVRAIQTKGLEIVTEGGSHVDFISAALPSESKGEFDLIIILTKAMQTGEMMNACKHLIHKDTHILTLQNGLGNIETLEKYLPKDQLIAGVTTFGSRLLGPGRIEALGSGVVEIMKVDGLKTRELENINKAMREAGMNSTISSDVLISIWNKVAINCTLNTLCTLVGSPIIDLGHYNGIEEVMKGIVDEIVEVGAAEKIQLQADKIMKTLQGLFEPSKTGNHLPSMLQDMQNGRKTEIEYLNGAIVKIAEKHNISVPNNSLISHLISMMEKTRSLKCS